MKRSDGKVKRVDTNFDYDQIQVKRQCHSTNKSQIKLVTMKSHLNLKCLTTLLYLSPFNKVQYEKKEVFHERKRDTRIIILR